ncbi:MAG TPA: NUDIX domain-containing protein [Candidatus Saccharimonadales bacterium]|nr:NUDIX domain-containing protein [Candidatus Saccharimonadales bacterium]
MHETFEVVITAIVSRGNKYLIMRRSATKRRFPGMWTVPGGHLETKDFIGTPKETKEYWYNVLEKALRREVREEAGIEIKDIEYVTSLATIHKDGAPSLVVSCLARYDSGDITLQLEETDRAEWVSLREAKNYKLIDGIYDELVMADSVRRGRRTEWARSTSL